MNLQEGKTGSVNYLQRTESEKTASEKSELLWVLRGTDANYFRLVGDKNLSWALLANFHMQMTHGLQIMKEVDTNFLITSALQCYD